MFETLKSRLEGCVHTVFTPFDAVLEIDFDALEQHLKDMYARGARKFYVMAYNSRYSQLRDDEIFALNAFVSRVVKSLSRDNVMIVGDPIHCSTKTSVEFARHAKESGADMLSAIMREKYFSDEQVLEHFATIGRDADFPVLVHEMPFLSGADGTQMHWPLSLLDGLRTIPHVVALKEDAKDPVITRAALSLEPDIRVVIAGRKSVLRNYFDDGVRAYLNGISMLDAAIGEAFWLAVANKDEATQSEIIDDLEAPLFDGCVAKYGWHRVNKAALQAAGFMHRRDRMPLKHLDESEYQHVADVVQLVLARAQTRFPR